MGRIEQVEAVRPKWKVQVVPIPREDAERELDAALDLLADALAANRCPRIGARHSNFQ